MASYQLDVLQLVGEVLHAGAHRAEGAGQPVQTLPGRLAPLLLRQEVALTLLQHLLTAGRGRAEKKRVSKGPAE